MSELSRRSFVAGVGATAVAGLLPSQSAFAAPDNRLVMWRDPSCGCCGVWADRIRAAFNRPLMILQTSDMAAIKRARGVPEDLRSCHTALISNYVIEGHVPPADILRLMRSRNRQVTGLAVPGMPAGSPGMDVGHDRRDPYQVFAFGPGGRRAVFASHG